MGFAICRRTHSLHTYRRPHSHSHKTHSIRKTIPSRHETTRKGRVLIKVGWLLLIFSALHRARHIRMDALTQSAFISGNLVLFSCLSPYAVHLPYPPL